MNVPVLPGIVDLVALQRIVAAILADDPRLAYVPVALEMDFYMENITTVDALWTLPRSAITLTPTGMVLNASATPGPCGAGLLVEMPGATSDSPGVSGPPMTWDVNVVAFEERNANFLGANSASQPGTTVGTCIMSEQLAQLAQDVLHLQFIYGFGTLQSKSATVAPAHDWMQRCPGIVCNRAALKAVVGRQQTTRTAAATPTITGGVCMIACADPLAAIYYTIDGSAPVAANVGQQNPGPSGTGAQLYTLPFAVASGTTVLCAARSPGLILSPVRGATA